MLMKNFEFKGFMKSAMPAIQEKLITCKPDTRHQNISVTRKYMHAETLALLTKPLYFPNMKYLK